ncbi:MAG: WG repeat-containing protein [bacterium]|nr:WG repeat-containing protein [bacterium]
MAMRLRIGMLPHVDYALIDRNGNIQFRLQTLHAETPSEGLIRFELNGKWGFADRSGKFVIPPKYEAAFDFSEGFAAVRIGNGWGYIDAGDKLAININYNVADAFKNGIARVAWPGGKWGYIDRAGRTIWESKTATGMSAPSGDTDS